MTSAPAKINLALVVGPQRPDGKHEVVTVLDRVGLHDTVCVQRGRAGAGVEVVGFADDTIVRAALQALTDTAGGDASFSATITKRIPLAAGLGGGSSDAAAALHQANRLLDEPLAEDEVMTIATRIGADVPFFLRAGAQLGTGDGSTLSPLRLPRGYHVVLWLPEGHVKESTAAVYEAFDARRGADGFPARRDALLEQIARVSVPRDLAALPRNDLVGSPLAPELEALGAFRADVTGAGPVLYGLFDDADTAASAADAVGRRGRAWVTEPARES